MVVAWEEVCSLTTAGVVEVPGDQGELNVLKETLHGSDSILYATRNSHQQLSSFYVLFSIRDIE